MVLVIRCLMRGCEESISVVKCSWVKCGSVAKCGSVLMVRVIRCLMTGTEVSISVVKCSLVKCGEV
jgi:hypothetical protein